MKKKSVTILTSHLNTHSVQRIIEENAQLGQKISILNPSDILTQFPLKIQTDLVLSRSTGLNFDDLDLTLLAHIEKLKIETRNCEQAIRSLRNKDHQIMLLQSLGANIPSTLIFRGKNNNEIAFQAKLKELSENKWVQKKDRETFIVKAQRGNKGIGVNIVKGIDSLLSILETFWALKDQRFLIQPFLFHEKEYRVFLIKDKLQVIVEKKMKHDFRANAERAKTKLVAKTSEAKLSKMIAEAHRLLKELNLYYAGFDFFLMPNGDFILGEVNAMPGFENIEKLSGKNIARELIS